MERWAKLFEANGRQVLITKDLDDEDNPKLGISIRIDGEELTLGPVFGGSNGDELLKKAFNSAGQDVANAFTEALVGCESVMDATRILMERS